VDHLNHLLTDDPVLKELGLGGGLNYWLVKNTQAVSQQATSARAAWQHQDSPALRQHLVNILYYLDGTVCAPSALSRVPSGTPTRPETALAHDTAASLLECKQNVKFSGLLSHIQFHMVGVIHAPGSSHYQLELSQQIQTKLAQVQSWFGQLHQIVLQLLQMPDTQLLQPAQQSLLDTTVGLANAASSGTSSQPGVQQVSSDIQHLATFDIFSCPGPNNECMS
jgi:hypothetical protein